MALRFGVMVGASLLTLPVAAGVPMPPAIGLGPAFAGPAPILVQAAPAADPLGAHAAVQQAQAGLSEIDATITLLDGGAQKLVDDQRKRALDALQHIKAIRDSYRAAIDGLVAQAGQMTAAQMAKARATLAADWAQFEQGLDGYFNAIHMDIANRKAILQARLDAEKHYWQQSITDLKASVADVTAEKRAEIDAGIAQLQARADAAEARLAKLQAAKSEALSALRKGLLDSRQLFGQTYGAVQTAIDKAKQ